MHIFIAAFKPLVLMSLKNRSLCLRMGLCATNMCIWAAKFTPSPNACELIFCSAVVKGKRYAVKFPKKHRILKQYIVFLKRHFALPRERTNTGRGWSRLMPQFILSAPPTNKLARKISPLPIKRSQNEVEVKNAAVPWSALPAWAQVFNGGHLLIHQLGRGSVSIKSHLCAREKFVCKLRWWRASAAAESAFARRLLLN